MTFSNLFSNSDLPIEVQLSDLNSQYWVGDTWSIVGGKAVNTPSVESAVTVSNPEFTTDTTDWTQYNSTISRVDSETDPGSLSHGLDKWCLKLIDGGVDARATFGSLSTTIGSWYKFSSVLYSPSSNTDLRVGLVGCGTFLASEAYGFVRSSSNNIWEAANISFLSSSVVLYLKLKTNSATNGDVAYFDKIVVNKLSLPTLSRLTNFGSQYGRLKARWSIAEGVQAGVNMCVDNPYNTLNMVTAQHNRTNLTFSKRVNGVVTVFFSTAVTYVDNANIEIRRAPGTNVFQAFYNNAQVGTNQTISDATIIDNPWHGLFSTDSQNQCSDFSFVSV